MEIDWGKLSFTLQGERDASMTDSDPIRAWVNGKEHIVETLTQLRARVRESRCTQYGEFALFQGELPVHNFFVLFNHRKAWLTYTYNLDEKSFSIRNPDASTEVEIDFRWANGQVDTVSATHVVPAHDAVRAIEHFFRTHELDPNICWHRDF